MSESRSNVEVVHGFYEARRRCDDDAALELLAPDAEFDLSVSEGPYRGIYRGHNEIEGLWEDVGDSWSQNWLEIEQEFVAGDRVVIGVKHHTRGQSSGVQAAARGAQVVTVRGGKIVAMKLFQTLDDACTAAGLRRS